MSELANLSFHLQQEIEFSVFIQTPPLLQAQPLKGWAICLATGLGHDRAKILQSF